MQLNPTHISTEKAPKNKIINFGFLSVRVWLAVILLSYGISKLLNNQFGISTEEMKLPIQDLSLFKVSWYLAAHEPFKSFIGLSQVTAAILLLYRKTSLIGAFVAMPIWLNILVWDISFMVEEMKTMFSIRLTAYLIMTLLLIWKEREQVLTAFKLLVKASSTNKPFPIWVYLLAILPFLILECLPYIFSYIKHLVSQ